MKTNEEAFRVFCRAKMKRSAQDEVTITDAHDDEEVVNVASVSKKSKRSCPYLDTVDRSVLDFDFEKICSVSFLPVNVYACLVCGKYFQGRGKGSHAYTHSLQVEHHVFINLQNKKAYCLPDDYEIEDSSLDDVKVLFRVLFFAVANTDPDFFGRCLAVSTCMVYLLAHLGRSHNFSGQKYLDPQLPKETIASLDKNVVLNRTLDGKQYICGVVGLNNINAHDHINTVLQALAHLPAFRDFWLNPSNYLSVHMP
jgi:U4/U6.U5 tri-snRNP-associated protein 2